MNSMDDSSSEYEKDRYPAWFLGRLQELRSEGHLVDVTLCAEGKELPCHRLVLSACTDYFRAMFCRGHSESKNDKIEIGGVSAEALQLLVDFAYTSKVTITADNVQHLFEAANMLQVEEVENRCEAFVVDCLSPDTCLGSWALAEKLLRIRLSAKARSYALRNFEEVSKTDEFLELPFDVLKTYISDRGLHAKKEERVLQAVMLWARYDLEERQRHLKELMKCVQFSHIMDQYWLQSSMETDKVFAGIPGIKELIKEQSRHAKPRQILQEEILVFGGKTGLKLEDRNHNLYRLDLHCDCIDTMALPPAIQDTEGSAVCVVSNDVIVTGGVNYRHQAWRYKPSLNSWTKMGSLRSGRCDHGMAVLREQVYVVGGHNTHLKMKDSVEVYNELTNHWTKTARLQQAVKNFGIATCCEKIYVFGGMVCNDDTNALQCYDITQNKWMFAAPLPKPMGGITACTINSKIYMVGGTLRFVLCYDPEKNYYEEMAARLGPWTQCRSTVCGSEIYITGGYNSRYGYTAKYLYKNKQTPGAHATVQCYNTSSDTMIRVNTLPLPVYGHHIVTISNQ